MQRHGQASDVRASLTQPLLYARGTNEMPRPPENTYANTPTETTVGASRFLLGVVVVFFFLIIFRPSRVAYRRLGKHDLHAVGRLADHVTDYTNQNQSEMFLQSCGFIVREIMVNDRFYILFSLNQHDNLIKCYTQMGLFTSLSSIRHSIIQSCI